MALAMFPRFPEKLIDSAPENPAEHRKWSAGQIYRNVRGWLFLTSDQECCRATSIRLPPTLFVEYKCNLDCWYCPPFDNKVKGMSEDVARRSIDWLHDHGCRVLALIGTQERFALRVVGQEHDTLGSPRISGINGAAERLGLKRTTLQNKMRKLGITRDCY